MMRSATCLPDEATRTSVRPLAPLVSASHAISEPDMPALPMSALMTGSPWPRGGVRSPVRAEVQRAGDVDRRVDALAHVGVESLTARPVVEPRGEQAAVRVDGEALVRVSSRPVRGVVVHRAGRIPRASAVHG